MDNELLRRIAVAIERLSPAPMPPPDFTKGDAFIWQPSCGRAELVEQVNRVDISLLVGIERPRDILLENTYHFAKGLPANNALLWGARGMGKSSLVKAVHAKVVSQGYALKLIELSNEDLSCIARLMAALRASTERFIVFCDDLSFGYDDSHYKNLKAILDGGIAGCPKNVVFYATSNRRHLMPRDMIENEQGGAISPHEAVEEKVSLSDRFGLWLGFYTCSQDEYLAMVKGYCEAYGLSITAERLKREAIEWQVTRGARSGRVAWQFFCDLAAREGIKII